MILLGSSVEDTDRTTCTNSGATAAIAAIQSLPDRVFQ
jgi:hypothetical protein